jgi:hypothetical protein
MYSFSGALPIPLKKSSAFQDKSPTPYDLTINAQIHSTCRNFRFGRHGQRLGHRGISGHIGLRYEDLYAGHPGVKHDCASGSSHNLLQLRPDSGCEFRFREWPLHVDAQRCFGSNLL